MLGNFDSVEKVSLIGLIRTVPVYTVYDYLVFISSDPERFALLSHTVQGVTK